MVRVAWVGMVGLVGLIFVAGAPVIYDQMRTPCAGAGCESWQRPNLDSVSPEFYAAWHIGREAVFALFFVAVAALMLWRAGGDRLARLGAFVLVGFGGATFPDTAVALGHSGLAWRLLVGGTTFVGGAGIIVFFLCFPDGRFSPWWTRWVATLWTAAAAAGAASSKGAPLDTSGDLFFLLFMLFAGLAVVAQVVRYRTVSTAVQHQQTKWVVLGFATAIVGFAVMALAVPKIGPDVIPNRRLFALVGITIATAFFLLIPLSIGLAMIRYRLWEVDVLVNRALVYASLTAMIVGLYVAMVASLGALLPAGVDPAVQLVATAVICLVFQPVRVALQRRVNRLLYGDRDDPYAVLSRLGQRLGGTLSSETILPTIVETVVQALRTPYAAIATRHAGALVAAASSGAPTSEVMTWPLLYGDEAVGELRVATRTPGEPFGAADRRLLDDLARQAGVAVQAVRLNADLRRSRERLVGAREEERRRLRRDLHDGLGPQLASQTLTLDTARKLMPSNPAAADALLDELHGHIQAAVLDIRRLVNALRPPVLDDLGLVAALREGARRYEDAGVSVVFATPAALPAMAAAVEVSAYRIAQEALTNVVRHAEARRCTVTIEVDDAAGLLLLAIEDDGCGLPDRYRSGVGLESMRDRATELGGTFHVERGAAAGTRVRAELPLTEVA